MFFLATKIFKPTNCTCLHKVNLSYSISHSKYVHNKAETKSNSQSDTLKVFSFECFNMNPKCPTLPKVPSQKCPPKCFPKCPPKCPSLPSFKVPSHFYQSVPSLKVPSLSKCHPSHFFSIPFFFFPNFFHPIFYTSLRISLNTHE